VRISVLRAIGAALLFAFLLQPVGVRAGGLAYITVKIRISGEQQKFFEMRDNRDGRIWGQVISPGNTVGISLQSSQEVEDGYGDLEYRLQGGSSWSSAGRLRNDQEITL